MIQKKKALAGAVAVSMLATIGFTGSAFAQAPPPHMPMMAGHMGGRMGGRMGGQHKPLIHKAIAQLNAALKTLIAAKHDEQGHREKAQQLVQQAINECNTCLQEK